jgi:hypothetical protein
VSCSGSTAVKCEHVFTSSLPQPRPDVAPVAGRPSDGDRDERRSDLSLVAAGHHALQPSPVVVNSRAGPADVRATKM